MAKYKRFLIVIILCRFSHVFCVQMRFKNDNLKRFWPIVHLCMFLPLCCMQMRFKNGNLNRFWSPINPCMFPPVFCVQMRFKNLEMAKVHLLIFVDSVSVNHKTVSCVLFGIGL